MSQSLFSEGRAIPRALIPKQDVQESDLTEQVFFESVVNEDAMFEAVSKLANSSLRQDAAAAVQQWVNAGDADFDELEALLYGLAGGRDDEELTDSEHETFEQLMDFAAQYITHVSNASLDDVELASEDAAAADRVFGAVEESLAGLDSDESLADFAVRDALMTEAVKKVIRDGKVKLVKTKKRKRRLSAAQKAGLKKARRKANTGAAKAARKKAMRMRKSRGM